MKIELLSLETWLADDIKQHGEIKTCPIWAGVLEPNPNAWCGNQSTIPAKLWYSPRAGGVFAVPRLGTSFLYDESSDNLRLRIAASRKIFELNRGGEYPVIYDLDDLKELARKPRLGIQARVDELLLCVERLSGPISQPTQWALKQSEEVKEFTERCMAATECRDYQDLLWLANAALDQGFLKPQIRVDHKAGTLFLLSGKGAMRLDRLRNAESDSDRAFVAMWFDGEMAKVWEEAIEPGLLDAGFKPIRIDRKEHVNRIDAEIEAEIRQSRLIVADFTCGFADDKKETAIPRGGVYFEAGFAHGLRIPVIWTCRKDVEKHLHFDTRQYNHLFWREEELDKFRKRITNRVVAAVGQGPIREGYR